jgi:uncharacterized protein with HEPN domain
MRPDTGDHAWLWDMRDAALQMQGFVTGMTRRQYSENRLVQAAVERQLEIIGEAARRMSDGYRAEHPEVPWRSIIAQRNVLAHDYGDIIVSRIWEVATVKIPELIVLLDGLIPSTHEGG